MNKILLLGRTGQVGFELERTLSPLGYIKAPDRQELNLADEEAVSAFLEEFKPDIIVNAAAWTAVDAAEEKRESAYQLNASLPHQLAVYSAASNCRLVHFSSDYVFPGTGEQAWKEISEPGPLNYYGETKLAGDRAIETSGANYLVFRTSWVYGAHGNNFMKTMLRLATEKDQLNIVSDQIGSPTPARLIAQVSTLAIHANLASGIYNLAPQGVTSWLGFAKEIFSQARIRGVRLKLTPENALPMETSNYPTSAIRPLNSRLDLNKIEQRLNIEMPTWQRQLAITLAEYLEEK